ncbi:asparagine synthase (glutamine-hydrolyzing) [Tuberibacillus sp. Marseille-P3662]|uniref:asparagine synthase (glutamine-hydrolyzing) n=1 Tax=Tuberibacillus sp. Marseille-P3662 TaxID=1965358 RepID=UPI000A1CEAB5|nr:asparagine synthase (glutamine-hydrolyzing) [Tuberibacillus sp. Marseille-P3662]
MCGITGWIDFTRNLTQEKGILKEMADSIAHRGPDEEGFWLSSHAAMAHRRLIVIDPDGGKQPMVFQEGEEKLVLSYNGEIYNYRELKEQLEAKGHTFQSTSDTEVLLHAYLEWREDCVQHLNGIFAFGLWDDKRQQLFMARDHLGVKPLFYHWKDGRFLFGSEIKALLTHPEVEAVVDKDGLAEIFALNPMRTPGHAVFRDIHELRAGHCLILNQNGLQVRQYWKLNSQPFTDSADEAVERVRELLLDTVHRQLVADKPVASMLSGGLDSSALTSIAGNAFKEEGKTLDTYSLDFKNSEQDFQEDLMHVGRDTPWIHKMSEDVGTRHSELILDAPELVDNLLAQMYARDLPGLGEMETSLYLLFDRMSQDATVSLSGESADEVFGGYPWFYQDKFLEADTFPWALQSSGRTRLLKQEWIDAINPDSYIKQRYEEALAEVPKLEGENSLDARRREMSYLNLTRFLPFMLDRKDRMSMANGFEVRVPFCDYRLVEYLWNVPWEVKSMDHMEKGLLRRSLTGLMNEEVRTRKKSAYPFNQSPEYLNGVKTWLLTILDDHQSPIKTLIDEATVRSLLQDNAEIDGQTQARLCDYLIQVNEWMRHYEVKLV